MMKHVPALAVLAALTILVCTLSCSAATVYVKWDSPGPTFDGTSWDAAFHTVQAGLNASLSGDEVWVARGTYVERITLKAGVALYGGYSGSGTTRNISAYVTTLDGSQGGSVVTSPSGATSTTRIDGFMIRNGKGDSGGGIYCSSSSPTIANNTVIGNNGGTGSGQGGGGIYCNASSPTITNNTIAGNYGGEGGGISCCASSSPIIANNRIIGNNGVSNDGGGIFCKASSPTITNNTIVENGASQQGGGIHCYSSSSPTIQNNLIAFNSSGVCRLDGTPTLRNNCVYGNASYNYSGIAAGAGDVPLDPMLADVAFGNVHIQPGSPCTNAGWNGAPGLPSIDMDSQARVQDGTVDIGADETNGDTWAAGPYAIVRVSTTGNDANDGSSWALAKKTVQAGLDAASALGGEVWVKAGSYSEHINLRPFAYLYGGFGGSESARSSRNWTTNLTMLVGVGAGTVVTARSGHNVSTVDGFTVKTGSDNYYGGGINCTGCSPTITNNTVRNNSGCGIYLSGSSATITANVITLNQATDGGGISTGNGAPVITNNTISNNTAWSPLGSSTGGGILCSSSLALISGNKISGNLSNTGGGIYVYGSPTITNNWITQNSVTTADYHSASGGAMYLYGSNSVVTNNTIVANSAATSGGGLMFTGSPIIANNIIVNNTTGIYRGSTTGSPTLRNNCVYNTTNYYGVSPGAGDISFDPLFVNAPMGDYHLTQWSPCINVGWDDAPGLPSTDIDGQARVQDGIVDIGADEAAGTHGPPGPYVIIRVSTSGNDANDGSDWTLTKRTVQAAIDAASAVGGDVWVRAGTYNERIVLRPFAHVFGGFAGTEGTRWQRNWTANLTILDGGAGGSVVSATVGHRVSTIDGFTIRNGTGTLVNGTRYGGGIYCDSSSPTIANNTIRGNAVFGGAGAGIYCHLAWPIISNNLITANGPANYGGGISSTSASPVIVDNVISGNSGGTVGGGIFCEYEFPIITNNTIVGNSGSSRGGGISSESSLSTITNNIVTSNSQGGVYVSGAFGSMRNNDVFGNTSYNYSGISAGTGDISVDPLFVNQAGGNYHITDLSPCINVGWNGAPGLPLTDMDGQARVQNSIVDMGADESGASGPPVQLPVIRVSPGGNDANNGSSWVLAKRTVQAGITAASAVTGDVWVKAGTYSERITLAANAYVYGGFAGTESARSERNWTANQTILDGGAGGHVVTGASNSAIDGFTIRNGRASNGGGIYCSYSSPAIANNVITGNTATTTGGGIYCSNSSSAITNNTISLNAATTDGAGVFVDWSSAPVVSGNTITRNTATRYGGGVYGIGDAGHLVAIRDNSITDNSATKGGGLYTDGSNRSPSIENNTIRGNSASNGAGIFTSSYDKVAITSNLITENPATVSGGGIYCDTQSAVEVADNLITANSAPIGGGIYCTGPVGWAKITNNTIVANTATTNGGAIYSINTSPGISNNVLAFNSSGMYHSGVTGIALRNNDVYGNTSYDYSGISAGAGDISTDPLFVDRPGGDYHITASSLCIDGGWNGAFAVPVTDMDGDARIRNSIVDIGADEYWLTSAGPSAARLLSDGAQTCIRGFTVSAAFDTYFYVEADDRSSGIRVDKISHGAHVGDKVTVSGALATNAYGERCFQALAVTPSGTGFIEPILLQNRSIGGGDQNYNPVTGAGQKGQVEYSTGSFLDLPNLNNIGLLISTTGRVTGTGSGFFYLDDGSNLDDGSWYYGIKVSTEGQRMPDPDSYVKVTGVSSCYKSGSDLLRLIRATKIEAIIP